MKKLILTLLVLLATSMVFAQNLPPAIFYSNITSAPNTGGQNSAGAFVTIHGKGFGASQGTSVVTIGGGKATSYQLWSDTSVTFQLGSSAKTGNIVVNVGGVASNSVPFTIRAGNIYFVSNSGSDNRSGSYNSPWRTVSHAASTMKAGDIVYLESGYAQSTALVLSRAGTVAAPMTIATYPNSSATLGSSAGTATGISITASNWVLSGLTLRGTETAVSLGAVTGVRLTNNDVSCPNGTGVGSCIATNGGSSFAFLGNNIHDNGSSTNPDQTDYQAFYLLGTNSVEIGWNTIWNTLGCNAIGAHSNSTLQFSYLIHDNYILNTRCEAIALGTVDPSQGAVSVYNNIIQNSGTGPSPTGSKIYGYDAIVIGGGASSPAQVFNNTIYNPGGYGGATGGAVRAFGAVNLTNNIFYLLAGEQYVSLDTNLSYIAGTNNLFFGSGNPLGVFSASIVADPMFANLSTSNFHLAAGSPAIDSGATVQLATDYDGVLRPQGAAYDIGAYEYPSTSQASQSNGAGTLSASPASIAFANAVTVGQSATTTTVLSNSSSTASVTISQVNSNNSNFQASGLSFPLTLGPGQSAMLTVSFVPTSAGSLSGTIAVASNATNSSFNITVSGTATAAAPAVSLSPTSLTFASQTVATTSAAQTVTLTNTGAGALSISSIAASGNFAETNTCGASMGSGASCTISVTFTPTAAGTLTGAISFTDNAAASPQQLSLTGTAVAATPAVSLSTTSLTFASQTVATTSAAQTVTLTNTGAGALSISSIAASGNFAETNTCGASMGSGASCTISVTFTPTAAGTLTGAISFTDNAAASPQQLSLTGTAVAATPAVSLSPTSLTFASQTVATTSAAQTVTLTNTGAGALSISSIAASGNFAETNTCGASMGSGASCTISVTFTPTAAGTLTGAISFTDNAAASPQQLSLTGTAVAATPVISLSATSLTFASQTVATTSAVQTVTLKNTGTGSLLISGIAASGSFAETNTCGAGLGAGSSCTISVTFTPTATGTLTGAISFTDNAAASPQQLSLSGTAVAAPAPPSVMASWNASAGSVSGYNVYRSTQSGTGYTKLNSSPIAAQSYTDGTVSGGQTYYYVVTSVNAAGAESTYSAEVPAVVPAS